MYITINILYAIITFFRCHYCYNYNDSCNSRTNIFKIRGNNSNQNYWYFDSRTFTKSSIIPINNNEFRQKINSKLRCEGIWCINKKWNCNLTVANSCYHVEHIIPTSNNVSEIKGCSCNIIGNLVMSYSKWNIALGNSYFGEKVEIYGKNMVIEAYKAIYKSCKNLSHSHIPKELCVY